MRFLRFTAYFSFCVLVFVLVNAISILLFSQKSSSQNTQIAIVLGAGTSNGKLSPVYRERVNHSLKLFQDKSINGIILTGGFGKDQSTADSRCAATYALQNGIPEEAIFTEIKSAYTIENFQEAKLIMDSLGIREALIVSDPLHMKRSMLYCKRVGIKGYSSPTQTSMYKTWNTKWRFLATESIYLSGELLKVWKW